jgi:DNA-binding SARP family transcriptional activator
MNFLGVPEVRLGARALRFRSRKVLALLAYLVLEPGLHSRDKLADLFWPESDEGAGRASLRNALAQINSELAALNSNREAVSWNSSHLELDVQRLELAFRAIGSPVSVELEAQLEAGLGAYRGDLLEGFDFSDAPDFDDWLLARREIVRGWLEAVLERLSELQAQSGRVAAALETAQRRVRLEPLSEAAYRGVIALQLQTGNRTAALETYQTCKKMLQTELGLEPSPETSRLIQSLENRVPMSPTITSLTFPTRMMGREREWALMEAAWQAGQAIILHGAPGVGKTRLLLEFAASRGPYLHCVGRPGDDLVAYGTHTRTFKQVTDTFNPAEIPEWVRLELARIVPSLGVAAPPIVSEADKLRFFEAKAEILRLYFVKGCAVLAYDDVQFVDPASVEAGMYALVKFLPAKPGEPRSIHTFRTDEISDQVLGILRQAADVGIAAIIEIAPLEPEGVQGLLENLNLGLSSVESRAFAESLHRFTGGNPLFVFETVRSLAERGGLETLTAERFENRRRVAGLPRTPKVQTIIQRRFERLSIPARDLAQVAAVAGEHFTLELGAKVLETPLLELSRAAVELEAAHVWRGLRFSHDLLFETTLENIPESLSPLLHGRVLDALEGSGVAAAVLAQHAIAAKKAEAILHYSLEAGLDAGKLYARSDAIAHLERVRRLMEQQPSLKSLLTDGQRWQMYATLDDFYKPNGFNSPPEFEQIWIDFRIFEHETSDKIIKQKIQELHHWNLFYETRNNAILHNIFKERLAKMQSENDVSGKIAVNFDLGWLKADSNPRESLKWYLNALSLAQKQQDHYWISGCQNEIALQNMVLGNWHEAESHFIKAEAFIPKELQLERTRANVQRARNMHQLGQLDESICELQKCLEYWNEIEDKLAIALTKIAIAIVKLDFGEYGRAISIAGECEESRLTQPQLMYADLQYQYLFSRAFIQLQTGQIAEARVTIIQAEASKNDSAFSVQHVQFQSLMVMVEALDRNWHQACQNAISLLKARKAFRSERFLFSPMLPRWLETEALLRGGHQDLARESVKRFGKAVESYQRLHIAYLRSLAALEAWDGNLESAIQHLLEARALMIPMGLPNERWTLEAKLSELYVQIGDLEKAREARSCALEVIASLAEKITDETMRDTFMVFAHSSLKSAEAQRMT